MIALVACIAMLQDPPSPPPAPDGPSLDEVLGIEGGAKDRSSEDRSERVARSLSGAEPREILDSAIADMRRSAELLRERETGLPTRRAQESAVRKLDELIASAERLKRERNQGAQSGSQQQKQGSSGKQDRPRQGASEGLGDEPQGGSKPGDRRSGTRDGQSADDGSRNPAAGDADASQPPPVIDPTTQDAQFDEGRAEWGRLPPRVRDAVRQGFRDPMSAAYRRLTQDYYRRLAGEGAR
jgi:hypothetical protein